MIKKYFKDNEYFQYMEEDDESHTHRNKNTGKLKDKGQKGDNYHLVLQRV